MKFCRGLEFLRGICLSAKTGLCCTLSKVSSTIIVLLFSVAAQASPQNDSLPDINPFKEKTRPTEPTWKKVSMAGQEAENDPVDPAKTIKFFIKTEKNETYTIVHTLGSGFKGVDQKYLRSVIETNECIYEKGVSPKTVAKTPLCLFESARGIVAIQIEVISGSLDGAIVFLHQVGSRSLLSNLEKLMTMIRLSAGRIAGVPYVVLNRSALLSGSGKNSSLKVVMVFGAEDEKQPSAREQLKSASLFMRRLLVGKEQERMKSLSSFTVKAESSTYEMLFNWDSRIFSDDLDRIWTELESMAKAQS